MEDFKELMYKRIDLYRELNDTLNGMLDIFFCCRERKVITAKEYEALKMKFFEKKKWKEMEEELGATREEVVNIIIEASEKITKRQNT